LVVPYTGFVSENRLKVGNPFVMLIGET